MFREVSAWVRNHARMALSVGTIIVLLLVLLFSLRETGTVDAVSVDAVSIDAKPVAQEVQNAAIAPLLSYQGRLLNPSTGTPQADGSYTFVFRIYNVDSGGAELWAESKDLPVTNGLFSTFLGDVTPLPAVIFNGQDLWLGVKVGADPEAAPRHRLTAVGYALYSGNTDRLDGQEGTFYRNASNLNDGTLTEARIDPAIARDAEVAGAYAPLGHNHDGAYVNVNGPEAIAGSDPNSVVLTIKQNAANTGLESSTVSADIGEAGVLGVAIGKGPTLNAVSGVWGTSTTGRGVTGSSNSEDGVLGFSTSGTGVDGQSSTGVGVRAFSASGTALQVDGPAVFNGPIVNPLVPIALGFINADGSKNVGGANVSSVWATDRYEITFSNQSYFFNTFVTLVTPICADYTVRTSSISGKLLVFIYNSAGAVSQCGFQFVTYKP